MSFWQNSLPHQLITPCIAFIFTFVIVNGIAVVIVLHDFISVYCFCCWFTVFVGGKVCIFGIWFSCGGNTENHSNFGIFIQLLLCLQKYLRKRYACLRMYVCVWFKRQQRVLCYNVNIKHNENGNSNSQQKLCHTIKTFIPTINGHKVLSPSVHLSITLRARTPYQRKKATQ